MQHVYNSTCNLPLTNRGRAYNPAFMHPDDMRGLGIDEGGTVVLRSRTDHVFAIAHADDNLRPGLVSISHGYGVAGVAHPGVAEVGTSVTKLLTVDEGFEPRSGQPLMTNVPIAVESYAENGLN